MIIFDVHQNQKNTRLSKILDLEKLEGVNKPIEAANGLPNECYINEDYFVYEREKIFLNKWTVVGVGSSIPKAGDAISYNLLGIPLIILRDKNLFYKRKTKQGLCKRGRLTGFFNIFVLNIC